MNKMAQKNPDKSRITAYFEDFIEAFASGDGSRVARKFSTPYLVREASGRSRVLATMAKVSAHFQYYLDDYRDRGCSRCSYQDLEITELGRNSALASVVWFLWDDAGVCLSSWAESYLLSLEASELVAFASVDHVTELSSETQQIT